MLLKVLPEVRSLKLLYSVLSLIDLVGSSNKLLQHLQPPPPLRPHPLLSLPLRLLLHPRPRLPLSLPLRLLLQHLLLRLPQHLRLPPSLLAANVNRRSRLVT